MTNHITNLIDCGARAAAAYREYKDLLDNAAPFKKDAEGTKAELEAAIALAFADGVDLSPFTGGVKKSRFFYPEDKTLIVPIKQKAHSEHAKLQEIERLMGNAQERLNELKLRHKQTLQRLVQKGEVDETLTGYKLRFDTASDS